MKIEKIVIGLIKENCYLVSTDKSAIVIDPGFYSSDISDFLKENKDKDRLILITHGHFDHIGAALRLKNETGTEIAIGKDDNSMLMDNKENLSYKFHNNLEGFSADRLFNDQDEFYVGDLNIKVLQTPGHTKGSVCYLIEDKLFSGDTLFFESYGRTDFPGGDMSEMVGSFYRLMTTLDEKIEVYPGHGEKTTVEHEKKYNPMNFGSAL